ncbi:MAG: hypothetical protein R3345_13875, partial [Fulvivirga sp.]|nr:hypothetical protein [Fulvivirga sp.]
MKHRIILILFFSIQFFCVCSQNDRLLTSLNYSPYAIIYELNDEQTLNFYKNSVEEIDQEYIRKPVTKVRLDSLNKLSLSPGHYLSVFAEQGRLQGEVFSITDFEIEVGNNQADLFIKIWKNGSYIDDADVSLKGKRIKFNDQLMGYWKRKTNKRGLLTVKIEGKSWYFKLERDRDNSWLKRTTRKIAYGTPLQYIIRPIVFIIETPIDGYHSIKYGYTSGNIARIVHFSERAYNKVACLFDSYYCEDFFINSGYAITNKPKYRPGDTVRFKALILKANGKPKTNRKLKVYLEENYRVIKEVGKVKPYRKGAYTFELILHDTLNLRLDERYSISIGKNKYDILESSYFYYEDYELKSLKLELNTKTRTIYKDSTFVISAEARDENDLLIPDARLELFALTTTVMKPLQDHVFVPDTLWTYETALKPDQPTEIVFPDSVLPAANLDLKLKAHLRNSENEFLEERIDLKYITKREVTATVQKDSLIFNYLVNGKSKNITGDLIIESDTLELITFPISIKLNPLITSYKAIVNDEAYQISPEDFHPSLEVKTYRSEDTVKFEVVNPAKIPFTYFIYRY